MSPLVAATVSKPASRATGASDRLFYSSVAVIMGLTVFAGFARTYFLPFLSGGPTVTLTGKPFTSLIHVHGALFTAWVLLFIVQTTLVANRRVAVHRRLGVAGAVLAAVMVVVGVRVAITAAARGAAPPGMDPLAFMAVPFFDMVLFTGLVSTALVRRRDKDAHNGSCCWRTSAAFPPRWLDCLAWWRSVAPG